MSFLEEQRAEESDQNLTCGDIRRRIQHEHRLNLLNWPKNASKQGCSIEQISSQLALCSS